MRLCALFKLDNFVGIFFYMVVNYNDVACESNLVLIFHATFNENLHVLVIFRSNTTFKRALFLSVFTRTSEAFL